MCFDNNDCSESICIENSYIDSYLPNGSLYQNLIGENQTPYGNFDTTAVRPFFQAPELICDNSLCEPVRLFFELTVIDNNNFDSSIKVSLKDTVLIDIVPNSSPTANAGGSKRVRVGSEMIMLDGSTSFDETPLNELTYQWTSDDNILIDNADKKRAYINIPTDLCSDGISLNEKDCCENNDGIWSNIQECDKDNLWTATKDLEFNLIVCDGDCANGYLDSDILTITYAAFS